MTLKEYFASDDWFNNQGSTKSKVEKRFFDYFGYNFSETYGENSYLFYNDETKEFKVLKRKSVDDSNSDVRDVTQTEEYQQNLKVNPLTQLKKANQTLKKFTEFKDKIGEDLFKQVFGDGYDKVTEEIKSHVENYIGEALKKLDPKIADVLTKDRQLKIADYFLKKYKIDNISDYLKKFDKVFTSKLDILKTSNIFKKVISSFTEDEATAEEIAELLELLVL